MLLPKEQQISGRQIMFGIFLRYHIQRRDSVVFTENGLRADGSGVRIPATKREFFLLKNALTGSGAYPASY